MRRAADRAVRGPSMTDVAEWLLREGRKLWEGQRFFLGACFVTACLLLPHAPLWTVVLGMLLAGLVRWGYRNVTR